MCLFRGPVGSNVFPVLFLLSYGSNGGFRRGGRNRRGVSP